jgi:uncharacterized protein
LIAFLTLELHIEAAQSLKDKRQVLRSLKDRLRASFNVSVAELDPSSLWNRATIGVVSISDSRDYLDGLMKNVERQAARALRIITGRRLPIRSWNICRTLDAKKTAQNPGSGGCRYRIVTSVLTPTTLCARQ